MSKRYGLQSLEDAVVQAELVSTLQQDTQDGYTVFAPTNAAFEGVDLSGLSQQELQDILTYHVLPTEVLSGDISAGSFETVNGATVEISVSDDGTVTLTDQAGNTATVITVDLDGTNGVVHIIDSVLSPTQ
ncbi:MAG: fasciclin domain-containing protein [Fodinibius sp.]|nr:fasciclin domain-containing protein [Fodinibius sp.]